MIKSDKKFLTNFLSYRSLLLGLRRIIIIGVGKLKVINRNMGRNLYLDQRKEIKICRQIKPTNCHNNRYNKCNKCKKTLKVITITNKNNNKNNKIPQQCQNKSHNRTTTILITFHKKYNRMTNIRNSNNSQGNTRSKRNKLRDSSSKIRYQ